MSNRKRHKILSDESVKYVYSNGSNILHDKSCRHVDAISNSNLCTSDRYLPAKRQCPDCALKAYIRAGGDVADKDDYISFFERVDIDENLIRHIFIVLKAKTSIFRNVMTLEVRGEKWKVKALDGDEMKVELLHSNFEVVGNERVDYDGYHSVKSAISINEAVAIMNDYSWQEHSVKVKVNERVKIFKERKQNFVQAVRQKIYAMLGIGNMGPKRTIYYVDGDNCPAQRIVGIENLGPKDMVKIFCAKNNSYFRDYRKREELKERCKCKVLFIPIKPGPDAVDFAIGMDAYGECQNNIRCRIYFISRDKHFDVIKNQIDVLTKKRAIVKHLETINEAKCCDNNRSFKQMWECWKEVEV